MKKATSKPTPKPTLKTQLQNLETRIRGYFIALRNQRPDNFQIDLHAKTAEGKEGVFNIPSLLAAVLTAQGLGKEVRLVAEPNEKGGTLHIRFFQPVPTNGLDTFGPFCSSWTRVGKD